MNKKKMETLIEDLEYILNEKKQYAEMELEQFRGSGGTKEAYYSGEMNVINVVLKKINKAKE